MHGQWYKLPANFLFYAHHICIFMNRIAVMTTGSAAEDEEV
jgi:hypothetical protein